jgi:DNA-binding SARP family transcriptional activator
VHSRISHLRRLLRPVQEHASVQTLPGAYCLQTDPSQVDTAVFESTVGEGFALLARGHTRDALSALNTALNLWRGSPLAGVEAHFARTEATRLEELRLTALDRGVGLHLRAGHHAEVIAQLSALVEGYPHNESLLRHLIVALYGAGRRADAVAAYRRAARQMREELGLDPSPETAELFAAILRADGNGVFHARSAA